LAGIVTEDVQEIWVSTTEAAEITGYNADYVQRLAREAWHQAEDKRLIKVRNRSRRYEIWLPDLIVYINANRHGPQPKRTKNS
jgi:hypothetical protein